MAAVNQQQLVNFLKSLNLDLSNFSDSSFDKICDEPSIRPFLSWFCSSFDVDNVLDDDDDLPLVAEDIDEKLHTQLGKQLENNDLEMYQTILTSMESRLDQSRQLLGHVRLFENNLCQKEKSQRESNKKCESTSDLFFNDKTDDVLAQIDENLQVCLNVRPYSPNIADLHEEFQKLSTALHNFCINDRVMEFIEIEDNSNTGIDNLEQALLNSQIDEELSAARIQSALAWLKNGTDNWQAVENINREAIDVKNALVTVRGKLRSRETCCLKKKIAVFDFLQSALKLKHELMLQSYLSMLMTQSLIEKQLAAGDDHDASIRSFDVYLKQMESNISKSLGIPSAKKALHVLVKSICHEEKRMYNTLLGILRKEYEQNKLFRVQIGAILNSLRTGPSLRFNILPTKLVFMLNDCQSLRKHLHKNMRQLAGLYVEQRGKRNPERGMDLLWVTFLNDNSNL